MVEVEQCRLDDADSPARRLDQRAEPLVIRGGARPWPAVERWSPEYLTRRLGPIEIGYKVSSSNAHPDFRVQGLARMFARERGTLAHFLTLIGSGPASERSRYLFTGDEQFLLRRRAGQTSIDRDLAPLLDDLPAPEWFAHEQLFAEEQLYTMWAWMSGCGVRTWLHYDNNGCHNINAQIHGRKRCVLYAPDDLARLHPFPLGGANPAHNCSRIDVDRPNGELRIDASVAAWHAELDAGDLLFIPAWWFHTFEHVGDFNANVNYWWRPARPVWNVVAARQAVVDAAAAAQLDARDPAVAQTLAALDAAALHRAPQA
ncbi:MAG TPA: cupin-like domain-containing protein [Polyangiaceae bacterium]|nr:cupin-like domain-containing protein [Polyangiaceae bacterium]